MGYIAIFDFLCYNYDISHTEVRIMKEKTCCFIGHRSIKETEELKSKICEIIEKLIVENSVDTFLFGSKSRFNDLCLELVTKIKEKHPHIKRIYVRAEYPNIDEIYKNYLAKRHRFFVGKILFNFLLYIIKNIIVKKLTQGNF